MGMWQILNVHTLHKPASSSTWNKIQFFRLLQESFSHEFRLMIHSCKCQKILSGTISLRGWTFSMSDGVMILAIFTCLPLVWHTKASPSCCNSSQRRFMRLCCRAYALLWKLKLFMKSQEKMLFWSEFYVLTPFSFLHSRCLCSAVAWTRRLLPGSQI